MRNEWIGSIFFLLLTSGLAVGMLTGQIEWFGFIGLLFGLGAIFLFRKKK